MKGERMAKRTSLGSIMRKKLSDITNSQVQMQPKLTSQGEKPPEISLADKDYIDKLLKEKMTLVKLIAERNKIIELSGAELQKLRVGFQKLQLQNWNLAQSNSHMLTELNLGREKLKALQHELACKDALLKAKNMELEGKPELNYQKTGSRKGEEEVGQSLHDANDDDKTRNRNRRHATRSRSMGSSSTYQKGDKEKVESKRRRLRRQSARFKSHEREPTENLFEIEDAKFSVSQQLLDNPIHEDGPVPLNSSIIKEEEGENRASISQRSSLGRPLRKAVEKVQSYKEIPLKIKMRRAE